MQLHKNQSVIVVRNQFCTVLTETWISDTCGVCFGSTSSQNVCDDQMLQRILSQGTFGELFLRSSFRSLYRNFFLMSTRQTHFESIHKNLQLWTQCIIITEVSGISLQVIVSHMEMFSEVECKKSNATTQELVFNFRSESVLRSVNCNMDI